MIESNSVSTYTKPKRKTLKIILLSLLVIILGVGIWFGAAAYNTLKKITSFSSGKGNLFSFLRDSNQQLKGQSEGRTNILILGMGGTKHPGGMLSDTMIVLSINWQTKKLAMLSIPRDLYVPIPDYGSAKINNAYAHGEQNPKTTGGGGELSSQTVSTVFGIPIHYFVRLDFEGFKKIVDTVGGLDITVEKDLYDPLYPAANMIDYDPFRIKAGLQHMDGNLALKYARSRETTSDFDRSRRQQQVIAALKEKVLTLNILTNPKKVSDLMNAVGDHVRTNLSIEEIKSLWDAIKTIDTSNIINKFLDTSADSPLTSTQDSRGYIIIPKKGTNNFTDLQAIAKNIFEEGSSSELQIEVLNGSGKSGTATQYTEELKAKGYNVTKVGDATKTYTESAVYNCDGTKAEKTAKKIAEDLKVTASSKTSCGTIDIQVILGQSTLTR